MEDALLVHEEEISVDGQHCRIDIYQRGEKNFFAVTRLNEDDAFICDGFSMEDALAKQRVAIPLALSCRSCSLAMAKISLLNRARGNSWACFLNRNWTNRPS